MYNRVVLKLSGEALKGDTKYGIDPTTIKKIATEIKSIYELGTQIIMIIGAGNLWRGKTGEELGMDRAQADYMGMLGTIMNGLAVQDALEGIGVPTRVMTAINVDSCAEPYIRRRADRHLEKQRIVIIAGGTGSPFFSTDSAAVLRGAELDAQIILMAKNGVDGIYNKDPRVHSDAVLYKELSHQEIIDKDLKVMDITAASMAKENHLDILVFDMNEPGNMKKAVLGEKVGTLVKWRKDDE